MQLGLFTRFSRDKTKVGLMNNVADKKRKRYTHTRNIQQYNTEYTTNNFVHLLHNMASATNKATGL